MPDSSINLNYDDDEYSWDNGQNKRVFISESKKDILKSLFAVDDFRYSNEANDVGYNLCVFDTRYQKNFQPAQPMKEEIKFDGVDPDIIEGYAITSRKNKLISFSSDRQRHFDLI